MEDSGINVSEGLKYEGMHRSHENSVERINNMSMKMEEGLLNTATIQLLDTLQDWKDLKNEWGWGRS
jgi:hypothetical protein